MIRFFEKFPCHRPEKPNQAALRTTVQKLAQFYVGVIRY